MNKISVILLNCVLHYVSYEDCAKFKRLDLCKTSDAVMNVMKENPLMAFGRFYRNVLWQKSVVTVGGSEKADGNETTDGW